MNGGRAAALILVLIGLACMGYAVYRVLELDQSFIPLGPIGFLCFLLGGLLMRKSNGDG